MSHEIAEDEVLRHFEETEGSWKITADLAEGSDSDLEQWIQIYTEMTGLSDEHKKTKANGIWRVVEARRMDMGRESPTEQEQGKNGRRKKHENGRSDSWKNQGENKMRAKNSGGGRWLIPPDHRPKRRG